jgi:hypothetical protein
VAIPIRVSGSIQATGSRFDGAEERGGERLTSARFPATDGEVAARCGRRRWIWWPPVEMEWSTRFREAR